jgi:hypothetical protein
MALSRCVGLILALGGSAVLGETAILSNGDVTVEINELGMIVGTPAGDVRTVDGTAVYINNTTAEWFGVMFDGEKGYTEGVGSGIAPDWGTRTPVTPISFQSDGVTAQSVVRVADMEITSDFWFDEHGPYLIVNVTLANIGAATIRNTLYTREWKDLNTQTEGWTFPDDILGTPVAPRDVIRNVWMMDYIIPGESKGLGFSYTVASSSVPEGGPDVPLVQWTGPGFPGGLNFGATNGISFGDYNADGWIDVFALMSANLWENVGGTTWQLADNLGDILPPTGRRYGVAFGDYNNDGLPDIATEPRNGWGGDECFHLLRAEGGTDYTDVALQPALVDFQPCNADSESICWADVDGDTDLDMFIPIYPPWAAGPSISNKFFENLGPTGPGGQYRLTECAVACGLDNPSTPLLTARPEAAQFVDIDFDGDLDLYSNGTMYQNNSTLGNPDFDAQQEGGSGIGFSTVLDEGGAFADYDLDGDYDLLIAYTPAGIGVQIWENFGDGNFFQVESGVVQSPGIGLNLGLSIEDWDNDGDMDFTTRQVFRRNQLMETGNRLFTVATTAITASHISAATPSWGDWDRDGDLDSALGNWLSTGNMYDNNLYDVSTPMSDRRYVRIRPLRDSDDVPAGLETEYGAGVEIDIAGDDNGHRRKKFTQSASGYLNQNEYTLHFAMPDDPFPGDAGEDVRFDVIVDFPSLPEQDFWRVDKHVNPALGDVNLADLAEREIIVFRSGIVSIDGTTFNPSGAESPNIITAAGGLRLSTVTTTIPAPTAAPTANRWVGMAFDTNSAAGPVRVREIILDGELDSAVTCATATYNIALWDITGSPELVDSWNVNGSSRNQRHYVTTDTLIEAGRDYRLVARVTELRATPIAGPIPHGGVTVWGGVNYQDGAPCLGGAPATADVEAGNIYLTMRFGAVMLGTFDSDGDGDVDLSDFAAFQLCFTGPGVAYEPNCAVFDDDADGDIDLVDFAGFQTAFTGPM